MKRKKIISFLCAVSLVMMSGMSVYAEELPNATEIVTEDITTSEVDFSTGEVISVEDIASMAKPCDIDNHNIVEIPKEIISFQNRAMENVPLVEKEGTDCGNYSLDTEALIEDLTLRQNTRSAASITQQFTDFLTAEGQYKFVQFSLNEGEIFNASLVCPNNANLDYDLLLGTVAADGNITIIKESSLGTYIDPNTGKTVDEGISHIHNQATEGNYAVLVIATTGSSSVDSFNLTVSLDAAGSYDNNEPNDSAFEATSISDLSASGSLHVENDQDWYIANINEGVYEVAAGNYTTEIYRASTGNILTRAEMAGSNYVLSNGTYYIKVFSEATGENFEFGNYTLQIMDKSIYSTMETAFDFGNWEYAYSKRPEVLPRGQQQAYYKFTLNTEDKVYASLLLSQSENGTLIEFLDNNGQLIDYGFSGSDELPNIPIRGLIEKSNSSFSNLVVNVDGTQTNNVAYIRVTIVDRMDLSAGGSPSIRTRIQSGYDTFTFSGTAENSGNSTSSVLTMDLSNNSKIPPHAIVDRIATHSSISYNVGGVHHQVNPGGLVWINSAFTSADSGSFDIGTENNIEAKQLWGFRYTQTAYMSTTMSRVEMSIYWDYDIQYTNYELFK